MSTRFHLVLSTLLIAAMSVASFWAWFAAPEIEQIAVHWNFAGEAVAFRSKIVALTLAPVIAVILTMVMAYILSGADQAPETKKYRAVWTGGLLALALLHVFMVMSAAGMVTAFGNYTALIPAVVVGVIGNYLTKSSAATASIPGSNVAKRWIGRTLVLTSIVTFATWILVPGPLAELVVMAGAVLAAVVGTAICLSSRKTAAGNGL